jgi:hypothetical protein
MEIDPDDLEIADAVFEAIVGDHLSRALALDAVVRWPASAWSAFTDIIEITGFDFHNPQHLAALQSLIDKACDA